jgi:hypothetical protein
VVDSSPASRSGPEPTSSGPPSEHRSAPEPPRYSRTRSRLSGSLPRLVGHQELRQRCRRRSTVLRTCIDPMPAGTATAIAPRAPRELQSDKAMTGKTNVGTTQLQPQQDGLFIAAKSGYFRSRSSVVSQSKQVGDASDHRLRRTVCLFPSRVAPVLRGDTRSTRSVCVLGPVFLGLAALSLRGRVKR